jgi:glycosyltransferase involved in cell wall biosynthesis
MKPKVSIIICTRNRAPSLALTLESLERTHVPLDTSVEVLIVDNGSTDATEQLIRNSCLSQMPIRYVKEPRIGLSHARNTGLATAAGDILLWTDDDVRVPKGWIEGMCRPILNRAADAVAGGVAFPRSYTIAMSEPAVSARRGWFASTEELDRNRPNRMVGANMAFHRRVLDKVIGFDVELGSGALGFAEETLFSFQVVTAGYTLVGVFDFPVEHHFGVGRMRKARLLDMARKMGRSRAFLFHHWKHQRSRLVTPRLIACHLRRYLTRCFHRSGKNANSIFVHALDLEEQLAFYREYRAQRWRAVKYSRDPASKDTGVPCTRHALVILEGAPE